MKKYLILSIIAISGLSLIFSLTGFNNKSKTSCHYTATTDPLDLQANQLLNLICQAKEKYDLKSVMFGAWIDGKEKLVTAVGDSMTMVPATPDMHFRTGGASFTFLTTLLLQLVDDGKINLQDKLSKWLPALPHADTITLDMLAHSTTGYADYVTTPSFITDSSQNVFREWTPEELIEISVKQPLLFEPGTNWDYSHTNYVILAAVLEKITGKPLPELIKAKIFDKLNLKNTEFPLTPDIQTPVLHTFTSERGVYEDSTYWNPSWVGHSARVTSNLTDMGIWLEAFGTNKFISTQSFQNMIAPTLVGIGGNKPDLYYGLGVIIANSWIVQNPGFAGYTGIIAYLPAKKIAIYITTTNDDIKNRNDEHYSKLIFKDIVKALAPEHQIPERF